MTNKEIKDIKETIKELKEQITETEEEIKDYECGEEDKISEYEEYLDSVYPIIEIGDCTFNPSEVLKQCDPIAFRCGFNDWADVEITNLNDVLEDLKSKLEDAEDDLKDLKGVV